MILWLNSVQFIAMNKFKKKIIFRPPKIYIFHHLWKKGTLIKHLIIYNNYSISNLNNPCLNHALYNDKLTMINVIEK